MPSGCVLALDTPADAVSAVLAGVEHARPAVSDDVTLELGYTGSALVKVFTGTVARLEPRPMATRLVAIAPAATLLTTTVERCYASATAADIVGDLAGAAGVHVTRAEAGSTFPAYVVDGRRSAYAHARDIADLCGLILYSEPGGGLVLERFTSGRVVHVYRHGDDLTALDPWRHPPAVQAVEAWGESPGTSRGSDAWAWLVKDFRPSLGSAGTGTAKLLLERPAPPSTAAWPPRSGAQPSRSTASRRSRRPEEKEALPCQDRLSASDARSSSRPVPWARRTAAPLSASSHRSSWPAACPWPRAVRSA